MPTCRQDYAFRSTQDLREIQKMIDQLVIKMKDAAKNLDFEEAAQLRDRIRKLRQAEMLLR